MTDRPILMSAPMVLATLREVEAPGTGKTETRRILKPQPDMAKIGQPCRPEPRGNGRWIWMAYDDRPGYSFATADFKVRFEKGDRLWVRETFARVGFKEPQEVFYRADGEHQLMGTGRESNGNVTTYYTDCWELNGERRKGTAWKPGIHMPRWASRLTLTITDVRVERLQDISEDDAIAEGIERRHARGVPEMWGWRDYQGRDECVIRHYADPRESYRTLWDHINGKGAWDRNPWIVAVTFKPERRNIDA